MSELITKDLSAGYEKKKIVAALDLSICPGRITALVGPNGAGKTTVLKTLSGILPPVEGGVYVDGRSLAGLGNADRARLMAVMMTGRIQTKYETCYEVAALGRYPYTDLYGRLTAEDDRAVTDALTAVGALEYKDRPFDQLSDGQKQRVLLARALAQEPKILILDEPTSFLDIGYKLEFAEILKKMVREKQIALVMSMHELELARYTADQVVCIRADGRLDRMGPAAEILTESYIRRLFSIKTDNLKKIYCFNDGEAQAEGYRKPMPGQVCTANASGKTRYIMVQGTMSSAGKSLIAAGLCRIFKQDGYAVAPFKSQNMSLNSYITEDGLEMGRAQVMQAEACGIKPSVYMNPILLKPTDDLGSQVIVNGEVIGNMQARDYFAFKTKLIPDIRRALAELSKTAEIIVIEGAGSPAEINLKKDDIVNMGMAEMVDAPVLLVGDIDRGGVFAQLTGTVDLLEPEERARVKGLIVNKFRGDKSILDPGIGMLEEKTGIPVTGVVPYMKLDLEDEDSLSDKFKAAGGGKIQIGIVRLPHISNFTDFDVFSQFDEVSVSYLVRPDQVAGVDLVILPGTKNTIGDMVYLREQGFENELLRYAFSGRPLIGICGGYQMLGEKICDPENMEAGGEICGLGLLPVVTVMQGKKCRRQTKGSFTGPKGILSCLKDLTFEGYEIHMGRTCPVGLAGGKDPMNPDDTAPDEPALAEFTSGETGYCKGQIYGTYIHGLFDREEICSSLIRALAEKKQVEISTDGAAGFKSIKEAGYDRLASTLRENMNMAAVYDMLGIDPGKRNAGNGGCHE